MRSPPPARFGGKGDTIRAPKADSHLWLRVQPIEWLLMRDAHESPLVDLLLPFLLTEEPLLNAILHRPKEAVPADSLASEITHGTWCGSLRFDVTVIDVSPVSALLNPS